MADTDDTEHSKKWDPLRVRLMFVYLKCHYREDKVNYWARYNSLRGRIEDERI